MGRAANAEDRKSTRLNSSHLGISYAVFCLKKKKKKYIVQSFKKVKKNKRSQNVPHAMSWNCNYSIILLLFITSHTIILWCCFFFFFNDTATTEIYTLSLHDALPISPSTTTRALLTRCTTARIGASCHV